MKCFVCLAALTVSAIASSAALGQMEPPKPGPEHAVLAEMEGTWDAVMHMPGAPKDAPASKGTHVYKLECGGMWLTSKFEGDFGGMKFEGRGIDGYDLNKKKYTGVWVDSMSSTPLLLEGTRDEKTKVLTMTGEHPGPDGKLAKVKTKSSFKDKDHHTFTMYMVGEDGKDQETMTIEYTRKKK
jgi:hypothetical protein